MLERELKIIRNLTTAANILIIVSIFLMGVPLDIAAIVCSVIAYKKMKDICTAHQIDAKTIAFYNKKITLVLTLSFVIFAINLVSAWIMYPYYTELLNNMMAQYSGSSSLGSLSSSSPSTESIWG